MIECQQSKNYLNKIFVYQYLIKIFTYVLGTGFTQESCSDVCDQYSIYWSCECDTECVERGDCCDDYTDVCDSESDDFRGLLEDKWSVFDTKLDEKFDDPISNALI